MHLKPLSNVVRGCRLLGFGNKPSRFFNDRNAVLNADFVGFKPPQQRAAEAAAHAGTVTEDRAATCKPRAGECKGQFVLFDELKPMPISRSRVSGAWMMRTSSPLTLSSIASGVLAGATTPAHAAASNPG